MTAMHRNSPCDLLATIETAALSELRASLQRSAGKLAFVLALGMTIGALPDASAETPEPAGHIEITGFAGDTVHTTVWSETGEARAALLHPRELVGVTWTSEVCDAGQCETIVHRIAGVSQDTSTNTMPQHGDNGDVWLYRVEYALASALDQWHVACDHGDPDTALGIFVNGQWSEDGAWNLDGWTFACLDGVIAKCVRSWGYKPWKTLRSSQHGDVDLQPLHQSCTRAARADYCGDGTSHTRDGTLVDMFDVYGFNVREDVPGFAEESTFDEQGALSVSVPRWPTATPTATGWRFATCERSRQVSDFSATPLIYVWSDPTKGRDVTAP